MTTTALFRRYTEGFTIGELPKAKPHQEIEAPVRVVVSNDRMQELGYVKLGSGEWVFHTEAVRLVSGGKLIWTRMG